MFSYCVCVCVCVSVQAITFECLDVETSFLVWWDILTISRSFEYQGQWRIQDFPLGGHQAIGGAPTSNMGTFWQNMCENERIGSHWGCMLVAPPPGSTNEGHWMKVKVTLVKMLNLTVECQIFGV